MPSPSTALTTLRPDLGGSFMEFDVMMGQQGYIATQVLPVFESASASGTFGQIPIEQLLQSRTTNRAPGAGYNRGNWTFTTSTFATEEHGLEEPVDDNEAAMYAEYFDAELVATGRAMLGVMESAEQRAADLIFNTTTWTGATLTTTITNEWDDYANAIPVQDVEAAVQQVWTNSGIWPDTLVINREVFRNLRMCDEVRARVSSSGAGRAETPDQITVAMLSAVFDLPKILVAGTAKNTANQGQSASIAAIWSNEYAMICKTANTNDLREPCIGRTIHWGEDGSQIGGLVETYRDETVRSDIVRVRHQVDELRLYTEMGHLLQNITT